MTRRRADYPLAETDPHAVIGQRGKSLGDVTLDAVLDGDVTMEDLRITPGALLAQGEIARDAGRARLAANFARAAELVNVPQDFIMQVYELLRKELEIINMIYCHVMRSEEFASQLGLAK